MIGEGRKQSFRVVRTSWQLRNEMVEMGGDAGSREELVDKSRSKVGLSCRAELWGLEAR